MTFGGLLSREGTGCLRSSPHVVSSLHTNVGAEPPQTYHGSHRAVRLAGSMVGPWPPGSDNNCTRKIRQASVILWESQRPIVLDPYVYVGVGMNPFVTPVVRKRLGLTLRDTSPFCLDAQRRDAAFSEVLLAVRPDLIPSSVHP